ncbi:thiolase family protein [Agreia pratensis]|nr:thiolase family protein [Agreia pratensis]
MLSTRRLSALTDLELPVVVAARRTPITVRGGGLSRLGAEQLAGPVVHQCVVDAEAALGRRTDIGDVVLGNCMGPGGNLGRVAALAAGLDPSVPGMSIDRQCGSGLSAIITAGEAIRAGDDRMRVAGGVESASTAPIRLRAGTPYTRAPFAPSGFPDPEMGPAAEALAQTFGIGRAQQDDFASRSHRRALAAQDRKMFDDEIVSVGGIAHDDGPRENMERLLPRFVPLFSEQSAGTPGTVTAGNSCRICDGAAAVAMVPSSARQGAPGLALVAASTVGCDPALPGIGPVAAVRDALRIANIELARIAAIEIVEAFSAQTLAVLESLGLADHHRIDPRVCADGGALALGHPWGASGAVSVVRLFSRLVRSDAPAGTVGLATAAIGGGMGVAAIFEVVR